MFLLLNSCPIPEALKSLPLAIFISGAMGISLSLPSAPANIGIYSYTLLAIFKVIIETKNIQVTSTLETTLIVSTIIIHLGSIIPDFTLDLYSYVKLQKEDI